MNTKIVYVLVSDKEDNYLEQAIVSLFSLRLHNPAAEVVLVVDDITFENLSNERGEIKKFVTSIKHISCPSEYDKKQRSRYLKTSLREIVKGDYLFIDTDTIICRDLSDIDNLSCDIGAVKDKHLYLDNHPMKNLVRQWAQKVNWTIDENVYYNSGVLYVKDTKKAHALYTEWHRIWKKSTKQGLNLDQPSLGKAISETKISITEIDGSWNCQISDNGLKYLYDARIIHYFASVQFEDKDEEIVYLFRNPKILNEVRNNKYILSEDIKTRISNPKREFQNKVAILSGRNADVVETCVYRSIRRLYFKNRGIFNFIEKLIRYFVKI